MATESGAIIVGGGIGGLCAAIALRQAGIESAVFERARELVEVGAGLSLWANAMRAFEKLGVAGPVRAASVPGSSGEIRSWRGDRLAEISSAAMARKHGAAHIGIHRADLQAVLVTAVGRERIQLGARCTGFEEDGGGVTARFADGREARGALLVGADGIHSAVRAQLTGGQKPRYAGYTAWRGVTPFQHPLLPLGVGIESWGRGQRFGTTHIAGGRLYWFATRSGPPGERDLPAGRKRELLERFRGWHAPVEAIIEATDESAILRDDVFEHRPLGEWGRGRVTLLGDAAHAMTPNLGQGACQAAEDAVVLAACLRAASEAPAALRAYERRRIARTTAVARQSRWTGRFAQARYPVTCALRDTLARLSPGWLLMRQLEWIVGYEV
jgi:2-polyprenyl-6-methoxyphenol hydroxylase-like FAD-dependent oxidoreductase